MFRSRVHVRPGWLRLVVALVLVAALVVVGWAGLTHGATSEVNRELARALADQQRLESSLDRNEELRLLSVDLSSRLLAAGHEPPPPPALAAPPPVVLDKKASSHTGLARLPGMSELYRRREFLHGIQVFNAKSLQLRGRLPALERHVEDLTALLEKAEDASGSVPERSAP